MTYVYPLLLSHFIHIGIALAIGLLVGSERGWHKRGGSEGSRVAGIRTFAMLALFGALIAAATTNLTEFQRWLICTLAFFPVAIILLAGYILASKQYANLSITTEIAAMLTFWLGVLPGFGYALPAAACAVVLSLILHLKEQMHHWLEVLDETELLGTLQFLLVSVVMLPMLPNRGFGPWQFFNPYQLWWMVVLISGLSLLGYFAMKVAGARKGIIATSLTGGLVSSTAVTMSLSRLHKEVPDTRTVAAGILLACSTMFARMLVIIAILNKSLLGSLSLPLGVGAATLLGCAWWLWRSHGSSEDAQPPQIHNPFQLIPALQFAGLLAVVMFAAEALQVFFGQTGLYALSLFTGLADVDAIVLSLAPKGGESLAQHVVVLCISIAGATNTAIKGVYCRIIAGRALGVKVLIPAALTAITVMIAAAADIWLI